MSLFTFLQNSARRYAGEGAVFHGTRQHLTFAEWHERSLSLGVALRAIGSAGDRVLVGAANCPEYPEIMFGIWAAGMVAVPVNAKLHGREMREIAADAGASLAFGSWDLAPELEGSVQRVVTIDSEAYAAMCAQPASPPIAVKADDLAWLFFTSGTTGRSKGAMLTHRNLVAMSLCHVADLDAVEHDHCIIHAAPMSHGSGLYMLPYALRGARQVIPASNGFDPSEFLALADAHGGAGAFLAPTMVRRLRVEMEASGRSRHAIRSVLYGGGPMYLEELKRSLEVMGPVFRQLYGQGEAPMTITGLRQRDHVGADDAVLGSVGWPRSGVEVRVVDEQGSDTPVGTIGEIICRSDIVMRGYWNNPEATAAALKDGWLYTGDMGSFDETGCLTLRDRSKDVIISGGTNIYPREVEEVLLTHPDVAEVSVIGLPDADWGEVVVAAVVREPDGSVDDAALDAHCIERISRFKRPKRYIFLDAMPKSNYGKVLKRVLIEQFAHTHEEAS
ncbi:AMP-binding protein [Sphingopyxis sp. SE2]|uniref:AMP-binding protein n=1 Tax=Sphingopyxis sp. SE2 TaxID=1586240 RepID=UPI0028C1C73A|nr:AMP-binding protein [Sphingopyxis sp. SE2]MDT7531694.1 AMP-binding protein [Sphingopyxis sp. SE2]